MKFYEYSNTFFKFASDMYDEQKRATDKFPKPNRLLGALMEEVGELAQALLKIQEAPHELEWPENVYKEAIQVAAVAYRLAVQGEPDYKYKGTKCHYLGCQQPVTGGPCPLCYE
jgi:NTP pyrophosphatase (non-canonical NTP hydrolase)